MNHLINWFKKDPLVHGIIVFLTISGIIMILVIGLMLYRFSTFSDPNYEEFGPRVSLYKAQSCAFIDQQYSIQGECLLTQGMESMRKNNPGTLDTVVEATANQPDRSKNSTWIDNLLETVNYKPLPALAGYPKKGNLWTCSKNG